MPLSGGMSSSGSVASSSGAERLPVPTSNDNPQHPLLSSENNSSNKEGRHLQMLRDELQESLDEEEVLLERMLELVEARSDLAIQVERAEAKVQRANLRQRTEQLRMTRASLLG